MASIQYNIEKMFVNKIAVFDKKQMKEAQVLENDSLETLQNVLDQYKPDKAILSSVIDHNPALEELLAGKTKFHKLSHLTKLPFTSPVGKPETIGADRLALAAGAVHYYPKKNIVD